MSGDLEGCLEQRSFKANLQVFSDDMEASARGPSCYHSVHTATAPARGLRTRDSGAFSRHRRAIGRK
jgi:hypothetical protein